MGIFGINKNQLKQKIEFLLEELFPINRSLTGDGIHDVAYKAVIGASKEAIRLIDSFMVNKKFKSYKQKGTGKNFLTNDFKPEHLRMIYNVYNNNIVDYYLDGNLNCREPNLVK